MSAHGETHHSAKLTPDRVRKIRASRLGAYRLAKEHRVSPVAIWLVRARKTWKHVA